MLVLGDVLVDPPELGRGRGLELGAIPHLNGPATMAIEIQESICSFSLRIFASCAGVYLSPRLTNWFCLERACFWIQCLLASWSNPVFHVIVVAAVVDVLAQSCVIVAAAAAVVVGVVVAAAVVVAAVVVVAAAARD